MANNRLYLKCKRTGEKVMLAKYYPDTGWYVPSTANPLDPSDAGDAGALSRALNEMFHLDNFGKTTFEYAKAELIEARGGTFDGSAHELEYETE